MPKHGLTTACLLAGVCVTGMALAAPEHPGEKFHYTADTLAKPYATPGAANRSKPALSATAKPEVPKGFEVNAFATGLTNARWMTVAPNGDVFLAEATPGKITLLRDSKHSGTADQTFTFLSGLDRPQGLALHKGYLYVGDLGGIWRVPYKTGDTVAGAKLEKVTSKVEDLRKGGHSTRTIAFAPDGTLYLTIGSKENISDFKPGAQIFKVEKDGSITEFASGLRNPVGLAFYPGSNSLFTVVNERDGLGDEVPPDYLTSVKPNGFYGYPYSYIGKNPDRDWAAKDPGGKIASAIVPDVLFHAHSAPVGLVFNTGSNFPAAYRNDAFVALHGSWNAGNPSGYKVVRVHFTKGKPENAYENFATGFWPGTPDAGGNGSPALTWGRPAGLAMAKDGSLLIADDVANTVWRVHYTGK